MTDIVIEVRGGIPEVTAVSGACRIWTIDWDDIEYSGDELPDEEELREPEIRTPATPVAVRCRLNDIVTEVENMKATVDNDV